MFKVAKDGLAVMIAQLREVDKMAILTTNNEIDIMNSGISF